MAKSTPALRQTSTWRASDRPRRYRYSYGGRPGAHPSSARPCRPQALVGDARGSGALERVADRRRSQDRPRNSPNWHPTFEEYPGRDTQCPRPRATRTPRRSSHALLLRTQSFRNTTRKGSTPAVARCHVRIVSDRVRTRPVAASVKQPLQSAGEGVFRPVPFEPSRNFTPVAPRHQQSPSHASKEWHTACSCKSAWDGLLRSESYFSWEPPPLPRHLQMNPPLQWGTARPPVTLVGQELRPGGGCLLASEQAETVTSVVLG